MMTFNEKIDQQFECLYIEPKKYTENLFHLYADYIELIALFSNACVVTSADIVTRYKAENQYPVEKKKTRDEIGSLNSEINDAMEQWIHEIFEILEYRHNQFLQQYPFEINRNGISLKNDLTNIQKIYLTLLLSSNLAYFKEFESYLTSEFEIISSVALRSLLPANGKLKTFGKHSNYTGNAKNKISALASDLNIDLDQNEVDTIQGNQERGLDLIAWLPFKDKIPNMITMLGQCACGKKWYNKQNETRRFESAYFRFFRLKPIHTLFIPYSLSTYSNTFYQADEINNGTLLFDRKRILDKIENTEFYDNLKSKIIIEKCIKYEEESV